MTDIISPQSEKSEILAGRNKKYFSLRIEQSPFLVIAVTIIGILGLGSLLASYLMNKSETQTENTLRDQLRIIAETKATSLAQWIESEQMTLKAIAGSPELKHYLNVQNGFNINSGINLNHNLPKISPSAEPQFIVVQKLLKHYADELYALPDVSKNDAVSLQQDYGLVLMSSELSPILSTFDNTTTSLSAQLETLDKAAPSITNIMQSESGALFLGFNTPITQLKDNATEIIGYLYARKPINHYLNDLFLRGDDINNQLDVKLVSQNGTHLDIVEWNNNNPIPLVLKQVVNDVQISTEAQAMITPNIWLRSETPSNEVTYSISTHVKNSPWFVVVSIPETYVLAAANGSSQAIFILLMALAVVFALLLAAVYLLSTSKTALNNSKHFRALAKQSHLQEMILKTVTNAQPEVLFLLDSNFKFRYANYHAAKSNHTPVENILGKTIQDVMGQAKAKTIIHLATEAMNSQRTQTLMISVPKDGKERSILRTIIPIYSIAPGDETLQSDPHVLVTDRDITDVTEARERRLKLHSELVELLVALMDQRDQHATNHSRHVADLAKAIARNMGLNPSIQMHVYHAGLLMNIGKMVVPERWLNSQESLDEKSVDTIRHSLRASGKILNKLDFDKEIIVALNQANEFMDGSGALELKGEDICIEARIITVANATISMLSPRAYRSAMSWNQVAKILQEESGIKYDSKVIAALVNYMENMGGKAILKLASNQAA